MERTNIHLPESLLANLSIVSDSTGYSRAEIIRQAIEFYIKYLNENYVLGITGIISNKTTIDNSLE